LPNLVKDPKAYSIIKQGWLKKKSTSLFLGWQIRYFVLYSNHKLVYYKIIPNGERNNLTKTLIGDHSYSA
jgi:hypothetical protein